MDYAAQRSEYIRRSTEATARANEARAKRRAWGYLSQGFGRLLELYKGQKIWSAIKAAYNIMEPEIQVRYLKLKEIEDSSYAEASKYMELYNETPGF